MLKDKSYERERKALQFIHWCKDNKSDRRIWTHKYRASVRNALSQDKEVPQYKGTRGCLTW